MRENRFYLNQAIAVGNEIELPRSVAHHMAAVLRLRMGDTVHLFNGRGGEYCARIEKMEKRAVSVSIQDHLLIERESPIQVTLIQSLSRGQKMDFTIQKSVELGVARIIPVATKRSNVKLTEERQEKRFQHWQGIIISACEQSGRNRIPEIQPVIDLQALLEQEMCRSDEPKWVLHPGANSGLKEVTSTPSNIQLMIGCEGGFSREELQQLEASGFEKRSLGPRVVRTETAALMALSAIQAVWGDF